MMAALSRRRHRPERPTLLLIDEAAQLGPLDELRTAVTLMRGYGVNTQEIYGYRPAAAQNVHRVTGYETSERLAWHDRPIGERYMLLRDPPEAYQDASRTLLPRFKSYQVEGGSVGTWMARLWKGEAGVAPLPAGVETPWDSAPILGISHQLGYRSHRPAGSSWEVHAPLVNTTIIRRAHDLLIVHPQLAEELGVAG